MKQLISILIFSLLLVDFSHSQNYGDEVLGKVKNLFYMRNLRSKDNITTQFEQICPGSGVKLENAISEIRLCADQINEESETGCSAFKNHFIKCSQPMINLFENCLPVESKEIPSLLFKSIVSGVQYLCKTDGEHIFELANGCIYQPNYKINRCERKVRTKIQQYKRKTPTKDDFCEFGQSMKPCIQTHLLTACGNVITRQAFLGLVDAFLAPCNEPNEVDVFDELKS